MALTVAGPARRRRDAEVQDRMHAHGSPVHGPHAGVERRPVERDDATDVARGIAERARGDLAALHLDAAAVERLALEAHVEPRPVRRVGEAQRDVDQRGAVAG